MTNIKFSVHPYEGSSDIIEVVCPVNNQLAVNLQCYKDYGEPCDFLEPIFNDFCDQVGSLVHKYAGVELHRDWIFHDQPELA